MVDFYEEIFLAVILLLVIFVVIKSLYKKKLEQFIGRVNRFYRENYPFLKGSQDQVLIGSTATMDQLVDKIYSLSAVDDSVVDAMNFAMSGEPSYLDMSLKSTEALDSVGVFNWIKGYVGERQTAQVLSEQGYVVSFPDTANEAGYDLIVDGSPYQVKTTLDTGYINSHLVKYPDIPVLVPEELAANAIANHENVLSVPGFSYHATNEIAASGLEELSSLSNLTDSIPIPILTSLVLGRKEYLKVKLQSKSKLEAVKDISSGVIGTTAGSTVGGIVGLGAGGAAVAAGVGTVASWSTAAAVGGAIATAAGSKVGTIAGGAAFLVLGPLGAAGVALGGAFGGAMLGRKLAEKWRMRGVKEKQDAVNNALLNVIKAFSSAIKKRENALAKKQENLISNTFKHRPFFLSFEGLVLNGIESKFVSQIKSYRDLRRNINSNIPGEPEGEWRARVLSSISQYPVISSTFDEKSVELKFAVDELTELLRKRGLLESSPNN